MTTSMTDVCGISHVAGESIAPMIQRFQKVFTRIKTAIIPQNDARKTFVSSDCKMYRYIHRQIRDKQITPDRYLHMISQIAQPKSIFAYIVIAAYHQSSLSQKHYVDYRWKL